MFFVFRASYFSHFVYFQSRCKLESDSMKLLRHFLTFVCDILWTQSFYLIRKICYKIIDKMFLSVLTLVELSWVGQGLEGKGADLNKVL